MREEKMSLLKQVTSAYLTHVGPCAAVTQERPSAGNEEGPCASIELFEPAVNQLMAPLHVRMSSHRFAQTPQSSEEHAISSSGQGYENLSNPKAWPTK